MMKNLKEIVLAKERKKQEGINQNKTD
jgi:hypothetical protein